MDLFLIKFLDYVEKKTQFFEDKNVTVRQVVSEYWNSLHIQEKPCSDYILDQVAIKCGFNSWDDIPPALQFKYMPDVMSECFKYAWVRGYEAEIYDENITKPFAENWRRLGEYLNNEHKDGKSEFRIAFQDNNKFIIHPMGENGETIDFIL